MEIPFTVVLKRYRSFHLGTMKKDTTDFLFVLFFSFLFNTDEMQMLVFLYLVQRSLSVKDRFEQTEDAICRVNVEVLLSISLAVNGIANHIIWFLKSITQMKRLESYNCWIKAIKTNNYTIG